MNNKKQIRYFIKIFSIVFILTSCHINKVENNNNSMVVQNSNKENNTKMDYTPIPLPKLIGMSDLVVRGEITSIKDNNFKFKVKEFLLKEHTSKQITVQKYILPIFFSPKVTPYTKGQHFVLFLEKQNDKILPFKIIGIAGEGQMPLEDGFLYFESSFLKGLKHKKYNIQGVSKEMQRFNYIDFKDAINNYNNCFDWNKINFIKNKKARIRWTPFKKCSIIDLEKYKSKSWLHKYLAEETIKIIL